jgi:hypothetical protein
MLNCTGRIYIELTGDILYRTSSSASIEAFSLEDNPVEAR